MPIKLSKEEILNRLTERKDITIINTNFENTNDIIAVECNKCHKTWETKVKNLITFPIEKRSNCKHCGNERRKKNLYIPHENYLQGLLDNRYDGNEYEWLDEYQNNDNKRKLKIRHKTCNSIFEIRPNDFQQGYGCTRCMSRRLVVVYLRHLFKDDEHFIKIGIDSISKRHFDVYSNELLANSKLMPRSEALELESKLLEKYSYFKYIPKIVFSGKTECLKYDNDLIETIKQDLQSRL